MRESLRKSGIDIVGDVPWGTHFCQFYQTKEDLMDILIPYFQAGLENNEFCLWVMSQPLEVEEVKEAFKRVVPDIDVYLERGQIEIIPYTHGYVTEGVSGSEKVINGWVKKLDQVLASGYEGLRTAGNTPLLKKGDWDDFVDYEKKVYASIGKRQMISLHSYFLDICSVADIADIIEVAFNHQFALVKKEGKWERIENFRRKNLTESKREEEALRQKEQRIRPKLENILSPAREMANLELAEILDAREIQSLMDDLYKLAKIPIGIIDLKGNVLVSVGWQDICTKFHRVHPEACKHCVESDTTLSSGVLQGKFKPYKCKNNMWDIATPIIVGGQQVGNIFLGQFFFEGEPIDYELFRSQARQYGFNEEEYIAALEKVPRLSREVVNTIMAFFMKLSNMLSQLGYSNIKLTRSLAERDALVEAMQESEERFRSVLENALDAAYRRNLQTGLYDYMSPVIEQITGFSAREMSAMNTEETLDHIHPDDRPQVEAELARALDTGFGKLEYRFKCKDGQCRWLGDLVKVIKDQNGSPLFLGGIVRDITERKQAEEALIRSEEKFHKVFNQAATGIAIYNLETGSQEVNNRLCEITGYSREELLSKSPYMLVHPDDQEELAAEMNCFLKGETSYFVKELRNIRADGRIIWVRLNASFLNYSEISKDSQPTVINIIEDITELKKAEEALKFSNLYNRSLIEASLDPLVTIGYDGKITDVNGATEQVTGYSRNELIYTDFSDYFTEPEKARKGYQQVFTDCEVRNYPLEIQHKDGHITPVLYNSSVYRDENGKIIGIFASARDISELKRAERELRESEEKFRGLVEKVNDWVWEIDADGVYMYASPRARELLGYEPADLLGTTPFDYMAPEEVDRVRSLFDSIFNAQEEFSLIENTLIRKDGSTVTVETSGMPIYDRHGNFSGYRGIDRDITERKQAEEALTFERSQLLSIFDGIDDVVYVTDPYTYEVLYANKSMKEKFGGELIGGICYREFQRKDSPCDFCTNPIILKERDKPYFWEYYNPMVDRYFMIVDRIIKWPDGRDVRFEIAKDITERKRAEDALRVSEEKFRQMAENIEEVFFIFTPDWKQTIYISPAYERIWGRPLKDAYSNSMVWLEGVHPDDRELPLAVVKKYIGGNTMRSDTVEFRVLRPDGALRWVFARTYPVLDEQGSVCRITGIAEDITQRKLAEETLKKAHHHLEVKVKERTAELEKTYNSMKESEEGLAEAQKMAHIGNWEWDIATHKAYWSDEMCRIFGRNPQESGATYEELLSYIHPDDRTNMDNSHKKALNGKPYDIVYRIILANGEERTVHMQSEVIFDKKNIPIRLKGIVQDITERKKADEKIQTLAKAVESSNDAIVTEAFDGTITSWNKASEQIYGYSAAEILGKNVSILEPDNIKGEIKRFSEKIIQGEKIQHYETSRLKKDGTIINVSVTLSPIFEASGKLAALSAIVRDITEHKRAEEALRESEARLRRFYESGMFGVFYFNLDGLITDSNDKFLEIVGYTREDLQAGQVNWNKMTPPEYRLLDEQCIAELKSNGLKAPYEKEYIRKDGSRVHIILGIATFNREGLEGIAFVIDITRNKQGEHRIRRYYNILEGINRIFGSVVRAETEEELGNVCLSVALEVTESQVGFVGEVDVGGTLNGIAASNMEWAQNLMYATEGKNHPLGDFVLHGIYGHIVDSGKSFFTNDPPSHPNSIGLPDSHLKLASFLGVPLVSGGKTIGLIAVANREGGYSCEQQEDLEAIAPAVIQALQRKRGEKALAEIDKIRIKEIHHRIKNNLQVISSLLDLQAEKFSYKRISPTPEVLKAFKESQDRIISMSLIHEELYKGGGDDTLDFSAYLRKLAENLFQTYSINSKNVRLCMNLEEKALFDMDVAVPLGIIVNELVSNSLKHAFPNRYGGEIRIRLRREEKNNEIGKSLFSLTVSDNGKGIPENLELESLESLGLQLVNILVDQLDGEIELKREHGTEFKITFNLAERS